MSSNGVDGNGFSWIQKTRTGFHVLLKRFAMQSSQGRGTALVLLGEKDVEKGPLDNYGPFDLRDLLTLSNGANEAAGIQPRHVGVNWENLQVVVPGDNDHKVKSFSSELNR